jgi:hypothetical protein
MEPNVIDVTLTLGKEHKFMGVLLFLNSATAYAANLTNFLVTKHTSALTLQVCCFYLLFRSLLKKCLDKYNSTQNLNILCQGVPITNLALLFRATRILNSLSNC